MMSKAEARRHGGILITIDISEFGNVGTKITLVGKFDIVGAETLESPLATLAATTGNIVVDMSGVGFIASTGIRHLVMAAKTVASGAGKLVLLDPSPMVTAMLLTLGLDDVLPIVRSEDEARDVFAGTADRVADRLEVRLDPSRRD
jgi:anti-anti-sigma factor